MLLWPNCHTIGFEVRLATKVGTDFCACEKDFLHDHRIALKDGQITEYPTTKFKVVLKEDESRDLFLLSKCVSLTEHDIEEIDADCWLVSPVIDEVPLNVLKSIVKDGGKRDFVMLNPQGYIRSINDSSGAISLVDELTLRSVWHNSNKCR